jgi:ribose transport system permease protein
MALATRQASRMNAKTSIQPGTMHSAKVDPDLRSVAEKPLPVRALSHTAAIVLLLDVVLVIVFTLLSRDHVFWSLANLQALLLAGTQALLLAVAIALLLGGGLIDLSLGANLVLSSVVGGLVIQSIAGPFSVTGDYSNLWLAIGCGFLGALGMGTLFGLFNALVIAWFNLNSLIATLATLGIGTGLALVITKGGDVSGLPQALQTSIGLNMIGGVVPLPALAAIAIAILAHLLLRYTRFGMRTLAMGSSRTAAERNGINTQRQIVYLGMIGGALAGLAGFVDLARFGATTVAGHSEAVLQAIAAVIIGGTLLEGGRVSIVGAFFGTVLAVVLQSGLIIVGVAPFYQVIAVGEVLLSAIIIDRRRQPATTC